MTAPTAQLTLFGDRLRPTTRVETNREMTIEERFKAFHEANPHVAQALAEMDLGG